MKQYRSKGGWLLAPHDRPLRLSACLAGGRPHPRVPGWVAAPDAPGTRQALESLGYTYQAPVAYDWPGGQVPMVHQRATVEFLLAHRRALVLNDMGTGKTLSAIWAMDRLMEAEEVGKALIICPLSTVKFTWGQALFRTLAAKGIRYEELLAPTTSRLKKLKGDQRVDVLNHGHAAFESIAPHVVGRYDLLIIDEAAVYRNVGKAWRDLRRWLALPGNAHLRLWAMTGTPTPQRPADSWALSQLVGNPLAPKTWYKARDQLEYKPKPEGYRWVPRNGWRHHVERLLKPSIRYKLSECVDIPPTTTQARSVALTDHQRKAYKQMKDQLVAEVEGGQVTAANAGVKMMRLVQICGGAGYVDGAEHVVPVDCKPRLEQTREVLDQTEGKAIVFVPYLGVLKLVHEALSEHYACAVVTGATRADVRADTFRAFQEDASPRVLLAIPQTMSHGLTLTAASTILWWSPITSNETYRQACARVDRIGKHQPCSIVQLVSSPVEKALYASIEGKQANQAALLEALTEEAR